MKGTNLTVKDLSELSRLINQHHISDFALQELKLTGVQYDNASGYMVFTLSQGIHKGLRMWLNKRDNNAAMLRAHIKDGVQNQIINFPILEVVREKFNDQDHFSEADLSELAKHFAQSQSAWEDFAEVYLGISPAEILAYQPAKMDDIYPKIQGVLRVWKSKDYEAGTMEELLRLMEEAREAGHMENEPIEWLQMRTAPQGTPQLYQQINTNQTDNR